MATKEKGRPAGDPIPKRVLENAAESKSSIEFAQALARSVFGRNYIVVHKPTSKRFRTRARTGIRAWRAPA